MLKRFVLKKEIKNDLTKALKKDNKTECSTLRMLLAGILNKEKEKKYKTSKEELTDEEIIEIIFSEIKKRKEAISEFEKGRRIDLAEKEKKEMEVLEKYLPEQLSEQELKKIVEEAIEKVWAKEVKDMGKVMTEIMPKVKGKADGGMVSRIVKELLSKPKVE